MAGVNACHPPSLRKRPLAEQYYNPQEDPGSEKRTIIVIAFTLLLLIGAQFYFKSPQPPAPETKPAGTAATQTSTPNPNPPTTSAVPSKANVQQQKQIATKQ